MKRYGYLFEQIVSFGNLARAADKTMRGQKSKPAVARLNFNLEAEILRLQEELVSGTYQPRPYRAFEIREPKPRQICAADVRDRVVHHAICNILEPIFERQMVSDTYACRSGKGSHAAVARAQHFARRSAYYLKCDVRRYFASIDHGVLKELLRRKLKDARVLTLLDKIIDHPLPAAASIGFGKGMPIGNLTSQHFANVYLSEMDHFIRERLRLAGYVRYMDDFLIFGQQKAALHETLAAVRHFLHQRLRLEIKEEAVVLAPVSQGIPFLGFRIFPGLVKLSGKKWARFRNKVRGREMDYLAGKINEDVLAGSVSAMIGHLLHADTLAARRKFFATSLNLGDDRIRLEAGESGR
jgi:RNA-directed DNA polymerase